MSIPPVTISDLSPATSVDYNNDQMVIRQGFSDKRVTPSQLANLRLENFDVIPDWIRDTDVILVGRQDGLGGYVNFRSDPRRLGFLRGVHMWFYENDAAGNYTVPLHWQVDSSLGDRVLAVRGSTGSVSTYNQFGARGSWQQLGHAITIAQMPSHTHVMHFAKKSPLSGGGTNGVPRRGIDKDAGTGPTDASGGDQPHDHGNTWRPAATVGVICVKMG